MTFTPNSSARREALRLRPVPTQPDGGPTAPTPPRPARAAVRRWFAGSGPDRVLHHASTVAAGIAVLAVVVSLAPAVSPLLLVGVVATTFAVLLLALLMALDRLRLTQAVTAVVTAATWWLLLPYLVAAWEVLGQPTGRWGAAVQPVYGPQLMLVQLAGATWLLWRPLRHTPRPGVATAAVPAALAGTAAPAAWAGNSLSPAVARHEAAHAVVWAHLGLRIHSIRLYPVGTSDAHVAVRARDATWGAVWSTLVGMVAGMVTDHDHDIFDAGSQRDIEKGHGLAAWLIACGDVPADQPRLHTIEALLRHATDTARGLLASHADQHDALRVELINAGPVTLTGDRLDQVLARCGITNPPNPSIHLVPAKDPS